MAISTAQIRCRTVLRMSSSLVRTALGYTETDTTLGLLYNLTDDLSQRKNLYGDYPQKVQEMKGLLERYRAGEGCAPHARQ